MKSVVCVVVIWAAIQWLVSEKVLRPQRRLPPGPTPLPIIGNLHQVSRKAPIKALTELAKIHGPLMFLRFGFINTVVVSSSEVARHVLQKEDAHFSSRTVLDCFRHHKFDEYSIAMMPISDRWRTFRKLANTLMLSNKKLDANEGIRMKKMEDLVSYVRGCSEAGVAVNIGQAAFDTSLNLFSNIFFSMDLTDPNSELAQEYKQLTLNILGVAGTPNLADFFPVLKSVDPQGLRRKMASHTQKLLNPFDLIIEKRLAAQKDGPVEDKDVLDALLKICRDKSEDFELSHIRHLLLEFFLAGTESTSTMLEWVMAEILKNPPKLKKAEEELDRVVGRGNMVKEEDFGRLPYLRALLNETFRLHPPGPLLLPRKANSDVEIGGFMIPKDSLVLVNVWAIGRDPCIWNNPDIFEPERFLNSETDVKGKHFELLPFGSGRRICLGMPLMIRMLPLMLGNLINFFEWKLEDGLSPQTLDMDDKFSFALQKATPLCAIPVHL